MNKVVAIGPIRRVGTIVLYSPTGDDDTEDFDERREVVHLGAPAAVAGAPPAT